MFEIASILGGIFLIIGAFFISTGRIYYSTLAYFFADLCWVAMAFLSNSWFGFFSITIGIVLNLIAFYRMHIDEFHKNLKKEK